MAEIEDILKKGGIGVIPTDTIYGLVGSALSPETVERIYRVRHRSSRKPFIILISSLKDLDKFGVKLSSREKRFLENIWPGRVSVILACPYKKFAYLHRGKGKLAFRLPKNKYLAELIRRVGPLVAPSANPEGLPPAKNIREARRYFGDKVDFYLSLPGGKSKTPSTLISLNGENIEVVRSGSVDAGSLLKKYRKSADICYN
jgi:L-threonylcarbamoyladenylate synthase